MYTLPRESRGHRLKKTKRQKSEESVLVPEATAEANPLLLLESELASEEDAIAAEKLHEEIDEELIEKRKKSRKAAAVLVGLISAVFGLVTIVFSIFSSFDGSAVLNPVSDTRIHVDVTVIAAQFAGATSNSICSGSGQLAGITASTLSVVQKSSGLSLHESLGNGSLTQTGACLYSVTLTPPTGFSGGKVSGSIAFPFGAAPSTNFDLGNQAPYAHFPITINLS